MRKNRMKEYIKRILTVVSPTLETKLAYRHSFHKRLNLKNPKTINEKILWLKLNTYYKNNTITQCCDKYRVRDYLNNRGMEKLFPKLYGSYNNAKEIDWNKLPNSFVAKCNHGCGYNIIVKDKSKLDINDAINKLNKWMKEDYWKKGGEIQYKYIKKKIIVEEYLGEVRTYKFYCFNGNPKVFYVETDKKISDNQGRNAPRGYVECLDYFDEDLNRINCKLKDHPNLNEDIKLPYNINEMIDISKILSKEFPFVRVDLYDANGKVYFSELTFIPTNGFMHLEPNSLTETWGEWLQLPSKQF